MYAVSTTTLVNDKLTITAIGDYSSITAAMKVAKRLAKGAKDCEVYGPSSFCYVGRDTTAVVVEF